MGLELLRPVLSVDVVVLSAQLGQMQLLLTRRVEPPFADSMALPGVAVLADETLAQAAQRALHSKAGLRAAALPLVHLEQLATFDALFRDPRGRTVSVAHMGLASAPIQLAANSDWLPVRTLPAGCLPFDHDDMVKTALERLRGRLRYTDIARHLIAAPFRIDALRELYELILQQPLNRSNFRSKLVKIGLVERVGVEPTGAGGQGGRPAHLYRFARDAGARSLRDFV